MRSLLDMQMGKGFIAGGDSDPLTVIYIEDNDQEFAFLQRQLQNSGGREVVLLHARNYDEAQHYLGQNRVHLVLIDHVVGKTKGVDLVRRLCRAESIPPLLFSENPDIEIKAKAMQYGAIDVIPKEFIRTNPTSIYKLICLYVTIFDLQNRFPEFLMRAVHDLSSPVRKCRISLGSYKLALTEGDAGKQTSQLKEFELNIEESIALVDNLYALYNIELRPLKLSRINTKDLFINAISRLRDAIDEHGISINFTGDFPVLSVQGDIMQNSMERILDNCIKYMGAPENPTITIACTAAEEFYLFSIHNNGAGFEPSYDLGAGFKKNYLELMFAPFTRLVSQPPGSGLGLTIVRRIIERHGGSAWASSAPNQGTVIFFRLPKEPD